MTAGKPKVAFYWCAGCGGCEEAVVDLAEGILDVVSLVDIVFWPVALDFKRADVEALPDGALAAAFVNGSIRTEEHAEMAALLRRKAQVLVAFGACAAQGGVPGLANLWPNEAILDTVYGQTPSTVNPDGTRPATTTGTNGHEVHLPALTRRVRTLGQVVDVDYVVPGCPPTPKLLLEAVQALLSGQLPPKGTVLAPDMALCESCPRKDTKPEKLALASFVRPHQVLADGTTCLLAQGLACLGPATRGGCEARCIGGNMPCTGCFGPTSRVRDFGAKALSALASLVDAKTEDTIETALAGIPDVVGTFYRYTLPGALVGAKQRTDRTVKD